MSLFTELKRRNVFRVAAAYAVLSWLLLQVADTLGDTLGLPDWSGKLVLMLLAIGFVPAVIFAWVYELTPEGVKKESDVDRSASITGHTGRKLDIVVLLMLAGVVALYFVDPRSGDVATPGSVDEAPATDELVRAEDIESIAVLPFEDFSAEGDQAHLARGIADTVLHMLAQSADLRVAARTSSFAYQGTQTSVAAIARELGVGAVLEGSVQRAGDQLRIIAQLIRASDQTHLWSQTFDRNAADIFAIQDEIARSVATALRPESGEAAATSARTEIEAYEHYLRGKEAMQLRTQEGARTALRELDAALAIDPDYVPALVRSGWAQVQRNYFLNVLWTEIEGPAEAFFARALELAPEDPEALVGMGSFIAQSGYEPAKAEPYFEKALQINPNNVLALIRLSEFAIERVDVAQATDLLRRAYELDPRNLDSVIGYGEHLIGLNRIGEAELIGQRLQDIWPGHSRTLGFLIRLSRSQGRFDQAVLLAAQRLEQDPNSYRPYHLLAELYARLDDFANAHDWYERTPEAVQTEDYLPIDLFMTAEGVGRLLEQTERDLILYPGWQVAQERMVEMLILNGRIDEGLDAAQRYEDAVRGTFLMMVTGALAARAGRADTARRWLDLGRERAAGFQKAGYGTHLVQFAMSVGSIADGNFDEALTSLEAVVEQRYYPILELRINPVFDPVREFPRFQSLMERIESELATQRQRLREQGL
jgi:TolB-like protein/thioredoxin-like negative regulator of GroEL